VFLSLTTCDNHKFIIYFCQINSKGIKKTLKIFGFSIAGIILFFSLIFILLRFSKIQNFIVQIVASELSDKLHTKVSVQKIDYTFFNSVVLNGLYVEDLKKDTLLFADKVNANFDFWNFFHGKILFTSVEIDHFNGNLVIDTAGHTNIDFIIKAFQKPKTNDTTNVEYRIEKFKLINSSFSFTNLKHLKQLPINVLNANKLKFHNINTEIAINIFNKDSLSLDLLKLNAIEKSGFVLTDFSTQIRASLTKLQLPTFNIKLPNSELNLENLVLKYDSISSLEKMLEYVHVNIPINHSFIKFSDLNQLVPELKNFKGQATFNGKISGRLSSLKFQKIEIKYGKSFLLKADLDINGLPNLNEAFIYGKINDLQVEKNDLQDFVSDVSKKPFLLPRELNQLGQIKYKGNLTGFLSNLVVYGNLNTNVGSITTDILLKFENDLKDLAFNGTVKSNNFQLGKMLNNKQLGNVVFDIKTVGTKKSMASFQGKITAKVSEFKFNDYIYKDLQLSGDYDGSGFDGKVDVKDDNINAHFNGVIDLTQKLPVYNFDLKVLNVNPNALKLTDKYPGAILSFNGKTNLVGNSLDNINGFVRFDSITFTNLNKTLNVSEIKFVSQIQNKSTNFSIASDFVNGTLSGNFKYSTIGKTINKIIHHYLPALSLNASTSDEKYSNQVDLDLRLSNINQVFEVFALPYFIDGVTTIKGRIDENTNQINFVGNVPLFKANKQKLENISLRIENSKNQLKLTTRAQLDGKDGPIKLFLLASAASDSVNTQLGWQNSQQITNAGEILAVTKFRTENNKTAAQLTVLPTQVIISDSIWNVHASKIDFNTDSTIVINNFRFDNNNKQYISINGRASKSQKDAIAVDVKGVNLEFIFSDMLKLKGLTIGGEATGKATVLSLLTQPVFEAKVFVKDVKLNHKLMGDANLISTWDKINQQMRISGVFVNDKAEILTNASGVYVPKNDSLDFVFDAHNLSIEFLDPFFESVVQNVKGLGTGKIRMFGPSTKLGFEGNAFINNGQASVKMLRTTYFFSDTVKLTRKTVTFKNIKMYDQERNQGIVNGIMTHDGTFKKIIYDVRISGKNMLALNTTAIDNDYFFGKAYANGNVHIFGDTNEANIVVNATSQPQTKCFIQMGGASKASDNSFINFVNKRVKTAETTTNTNTSPSKFNVKVNLQLDVNPNAEMELIVDPKGGDIITGKGNGNLRVEFDSFSDIKLFGTYVIDNGYYLFTLQNVIRKEFKINRGGQIAWTGNPFNAQVSLQALYPLTASLRDLMTEEQLKLMTRTSVPVNCVLKLSDNLMRPTINFDIDLPQSDESVKQQVKNIVNTEEMMNRQIVYLLMFNKFFAPERAATSNILNNEIYSFAVSTASAQFNSMLSKMFKSNNFNFGVDYRQTDQLSSDIQAQILYQPNNRWILNGNIGVRNDNQNSNTTTNKFIGDVDVQYLLSESGKFRLKGYSHSVDRYYLGTANSTQGFGFLYKEEFTSVDDLFKYYWRLINGIGKKKTNEEPQPDEE
jgi:hypothetical protein